jgi:ABC-type methionine transport system ATPase subunit
MAIDLTSNQSFSEKRIRIRVPKERHQEPIISTMVANYKLVINIAAAVLGANAHGDGWFDLRLKGTAENVQAAMAYLRDLGVDIWQEEDGGGGDQVEITG